MAFWSNLNKKWGVLYRILIFLAVSGIVLYLFPREGKFKYEFRKGEPWNYDLLVAPFSFPIFKSERELSAERDSSLKDYTPYYEVDSTSYVSLMKQIETRYQGEWSRLRQEDSSKTETIEANYLAKLNEIIKGVYDKGIIAFAEQNRLKINNTERIVVVTPTFAKTMVADDVLNPRTSYEEILSNVQKEAETYPLLYNIVQKLDLNNFIRSNLEFNKELSQKTKEQLLINISNSAGLVQAGERIIDRGEIVSERTFKILQSFKVEYERKIGSPEQRIALMAGQGILILLLLGSLLLFLKLYRHDIYAEAKSIIFIYLNILLFVLLASIMHKLPEYFILILPYAIVPITLRTFFDSRTAIFVNIIMVILISFFASNSFVFILLQITAGIAGAFSLKTLYRRDQLFRASGVVTLVYIIMYVSVHLIQEGNIKTINPYYFAYFGANGFLLLFAYPMIYIEEKLFGYLSDVTLMELSDTNNELLRKLSEKAPGTFQHSIMVSNLAQEAALRTGANPLLARTGALYHDIGKIANPVYFTENQTTGHNPHTRLDEKESAKVIIDHVEGGVKLAQKYNLPEPIIHFIRTHHGLSQAKFFYIKFKEKHEGEDVDPVDFTYPGPNPFSKEMAIMMMADAVEASSRSLKDYTDEIINQHVEKIIESQIQGNYFRQAPITFLDIEIIKDCFKEKLKNIYHTRIEYPEEKKPQESKNH